MHLLFTVTHFGQHIDETSELLCVSFRHSVSLSKHIHACSHQKKFEVLYLTHSFPLFSAVLTCLFILLIACDKPPCEGRVLRLAPA
ncbi:hypothetical protein KC354_g160 [Hortaea werneckii]|nr:hypothetical protein KC354_g160 [Hortaea werneckii]